MNPIPLTVIAGPTASGKTEVALSLASKLNAEIISVDSMKVYKGLDIGTAKPDSETRAKVRFHLLDVREPSEEFSVAEFVTLATAAIERIASENRRIILDTGSPLYLKALTEGIFSSPPADRALREKLKEEAQESGVQTLYERLSEIDPAYAAKISPQDLRRIIRALEVFEQCGAPISQLQKQFGTPAEKYSRRLFVLRRKRADLHRRIALRTEKMFSEGFVDEVRQLLQTKLSRTASAAAGYAEVTRYLSGEISLAEAIKQTITRTRQLAKRQMTWFRSFPDAIWIDVSENDSADIICSKILAVLNTPPPHTATALSS
jgi:tRNA dimethylallyltransferase